MNIEDSSPQPPQHSPEPASGEPRGERRSRPPRRGGESRSERGRGDHASGDARRDRGGRSSGEGRGRGGRSGGRGSNDDRERGPRSEERREPVKKSSEATDAKSAASNAGNLDELGGDLLTSVSRSFSLTIRLLPEPLREPITLGYLIARAQDTVADTPKVPAVTRLEHLRVLLEMVKYGPDAEVLRPLQRDLVGKQAHEGERELLKQLERCLTWLDTQPTEDRWELRRTLARIGRAQELDLQRFGDATGSEPKTLATSGELDEYTYLIAGCVGELWTRLCERHLEAGWSKLTQDEMLVLGRRFGKGLQLVNILRDLPEDLANGRCYLPTDLLAEHELSATDLMKHPAKAAALIATLRLQAVEHLDAAWQYVLALTPRKLRYAVALPVLIGLETLGLLAKTSPLESKDKLKISRSSVRNLMTSAGIGAVLTPWLNRLHGKLRKKAVAKG